VASAVALLGERLGAHQLLGALLLTGSVAVFSWVDLRPRLRSDAPASPVEELVPVAAQSTSAL
jgi:drug/metabolite transporter (DMT)-like permease